jgi:hypothetical protein
MDNKKPKEDYELHQAFEVISSIDSFSEYINEICEQIYNSDLDRSRLNDILKKHHIAKIQDIKEELLDILLLYVNLVLNDHIITENEKRNIRLLKLYFKIEEGDFYRYRYQEVEEVLHRQFELLYSDNKIDFNEALHKVELQDIFNVSYDQFEEFKQHEVSLAIERGAIVQDLEITKYPKAAISDIKPIGRIIAKQVKDSVWNRDNGKCRECGSNEKLEFDHIIPFSKGGSNTYRNIQLLCEPCNRKKFNQIG